MNIYSAKIDAQEVLLQSRIIMFFGSIMSIILQFFFVASSIFNLYCIYDLTIYGIVRNIYITAGIYILFSFGFIFSVFFAFQLSFNRKVWFYKNIKAPQKMRSLFSIMKLKYRFKVLGLLIAKDLLIFSKGILFFSPFIIFAISIYFSAKRDGIYKNLFLLSVIFLAVFFVFSLYFVFVSNHSYCLAEIILYNNQSMKIRNVLKNSKNTVSGFEFKLAAFKLSFTPWFLLSLLIVPLFFVMPYYSQAKALSQNMILTKENEKMKNSKSVVFIFPSQNKRVLS